MPPSLVSGAVNLLLISLWQLLLFYLALTPGRMDSTVLNPRSKGIVHAVLIMKDFAGFVCVYKIDLFSIW